MTATVMSPTLMTATKMTGHEIHLLHSTYNTVNLYTYKSLVTLIDCMIDCMFEADCICLRPGYGMATLIYNNLLNLILVTVMFLRSSK